MPISLTTDFGYRDSFVGIMKGVIAGIAPSVQVIDVTHGIPAQDVMSGALILRHAVGYFPPGTIHVGIVDPGVGSERAPLLIESGSQFFIGPDNGIFSLALRDQQPDRIVQLSNRAYHLRPTSSTFHGRDVFAPVAAYLSLGIPAAEFGEPAESYMKLAIPKIVRRGREIDAEIIYIDGYGNLFTNIEEHDLTGLPASGIAIQTGTVRLRGLTSNYAAVRVGELVAVINSWGLLEISVNQGNARQFSGVKIGDKVRIHWDE
jgi:S-adenosyl-L-methionine hydrolase (adenosine-forming)